MPSLCGAGPSKNNMFLAISFIFVLQEIQGAIDLTYRGLRLMGFRLWRHLRGARDASDKH